MKALSVFVLAALSVAGVAHAQTGAGQMTTNPPYQEQARVPAQPSGNFTDECGIRYNSRGDRIDARGRVLPPPVSSPSGRSCR